MRTEKRKILTSLIAVLAILAMAVGVYAYLSNSSGPLSNTFFPSPEVDPTIQEGFNGEKKTDVYVSVGPTGYTVYVRAAIVVTWKDEKGNVHAAKPVVGQDYSIDINDAYWFEYNGYYYCKQSVASNGKTAVLIQSCGKTGTAPDGYQLSVQILAQTIQAAGTTDAGGVPAVTDAWGVNVVDGKLVKP